MKRKTVNSILKGVAGVGLTLGGVSALSDANLVFAAETEQPEQETSTEEAVVVEDVEETSEEGKVDLETYEYAIADDNGNVISSMSAAAYDMQNAVKDAQESTDDATATGEDVTVDENASGEETVDAETPDPLKKAVEDAQAEVDRLVAEAREAGAAKGKDGTVGASYYRAADKLVQAMVKYYADQEGFNADQVDIANWVSNGKINPEDERDLTQNYLKVTYTFGDFQDVVYYDYINEDAEGNCLTGDYKLESNAKLIDHISIVEKTPIFADDDESGLFTFARDDFRNITAYKVNDVEIKVGTEEDDEFVVETTVTGNNASGYTVTKKTTKKADQSEETTSKTYSVLKKFVDKGRVFYKESETDEPETPDDSVVKEIPGGTYTGPTEPSTPATPQPETPETEIEDEDVPLADVPDAADEDIDTDDDLDEDLDEDVTDLEDEDVPLAVLDLDEPVDIPDADVPLSDNPETGDALTATWIGTAAASVAGLFGASRKKRKG